MEKELVGLYEAVKKAADVARSTDSEVEENRCLDAFKQLKKFPVNYQILVSTQVGKHLRVLTKNPRKKIRAFAIDLIEIWKDIIIKETSEKKNGSSHNKGENVAKDKKQVSGVTKASPGPAAPPKVKTMIKSNDVMRDKIREILHEAISKVSGEADETIMDQVNACDPILVAVKVESVLFDKWGPPNGAQKVKYWSLVFNLKDPKNPDLRRRVLLGEIEPERLINMSTADMASDQRKQENEKLKQKSLCQSERAEQSKGTTDQFECDKCGQRNCIYHQMQTRSADEPMTTFVTCMTCDHHWKV